MHKDNCLCPYCQTELKKGCLSPKFCKPCSTKKSENIKICDVCKSEYSNEYEDCPMCKSEK
jgi:hypothetical protein